MVTAKVTLTLDHRGHIPSPKRPQYLRQILHPTSSQSLLQTDSVSLIYIVFHYR